MLLSQTLKHNNDVMKFAKLTFLLKYYSNVHGTSFLIQKTSYKHQDVLVYVAVAIFYAVIAQNWVTMTTVKTYIMGTITIIL